jgi:hypothetical protein
VDLEIDGLFSSTTGQSCCIHKICGNRVHTFVDINGWTESAIKLVKIIDGVDGCTVSFVPRVQSRWLIVWINLLSFMSFIVHR